MATCSRCGRTWREPEDEQGEHPCPHCPEQRDDQLKAEYLGDGVYASFDGLYLWLDLRGQDDYTRIGLEPAVLARLDNYRKRIERHHA